MVNGQMQLEFANDYRVKVRKVAFTVWQPEIIGGSPWCVSFAGYNTGKGDVTIYHEFIPNGKVTFPNLKLPSKRRFADFAVTMIGVYKGFGGKIEIRPQDYKALLEGYRMGIQGAKPTNKKG